MSAFVANNINKKIGILIAFCKKRAIKDNRMIPLFKRKSIKHRAYNCAYSQTAIESCTKYLF